MPERKHSKAAATSSPPCLMHEFEAELFGSSPGVPIKRIYAAPSPADGCRVLVDRLWPRGISRSRAALDEWLPEVAPSPMLRKWFGHEARRFGEFRRRYRRELRAGGESLERLRTLVAQGPVTLLYAARDPRCNHAVVLAEFLAAAPAGRPRS